MSNEEYTVSLNISESVWITKMESFVFNRQHIEDVCIHLTAECNKYNGFISSHQYNDYVYDILKKNKPENINVKAYYKAIFNMLHNHIKTDSWHDGARAARRVLDNAMTYMTPGFYESKNNNFLSQ